MSHFITGDGEKIRIILGKNLDDIPYKYNVKKVVRDINGTVQHVDALCSLEPDTVDRLARRKMHEIYTAVVYNEPAILNFYIANLEYQGIVFDDNLLNEIRVQSEKIREDLFTLYSKIGFAHPKPKDEGSLSILSISSSDDGSLPVSAASVVSSDKEQFLKSLPFDDINNIL